MAHDHQIKHAEHADAAQHGAQRHHVPGRRSAAGELGDADAGAYTGASIFSGWQPQSLEDDDLDAASASTGPTIDGSGGFDDEHLLLAAHASSKHESSKHESSKHEAVAHASAKHKHKGGHPPLGRDIRLVKSSTLDALKGSAAWPQAEELYNNEKTFVIIDGQKDAIPEGWISKKAMYFTSYRDFAQAASNGGLAPGLSGVMYNAEYWTRTPGAEKAHPETFQKKFKQLAHKLGLVFISAPSPMGHSKIFNASAHNADVLVLQGQEYQSNPGQYRHEVGAAARHARHVNHGVRVISQVGASPNRVTPGNHGPAGKSALKHTAGDIAGHGPHTDGFMIWEGDSSSAVHQNGERLTEMVAARKRHHH